MRVSQEKVRAFHDKYGYPNPDKPTLLPPDAWDFRSKLIREELAEYERACENGDLVEVADALADLCYVILGTSVYHGIDLQPLFDEVHRSNMTKEMARDNINKPIKGASFEKPRIAELLMIQATGLAEVPPS